MVRSYLIAASLSVGWLLSPDVLARLGAGVGTSRTLFVAALGLFALCSAFAVMFINHPSLRKDGRCSQTALLIQGIGRLPTMSISLACRLALAVFIPTGLLVTAGFAFNEIFLYWFPNFGFAFLVLGLIVLLNLFGDRFAGLAQVFFVSVALGALVILCLAGLGGPGSSKPISVDVGFSFSGSVIMGGLLLFLGFDYVTPKQQNDSRIPAFTGLFFCLLIFLFWSMLSLQYVGEKRLLATTVPYMLTAREILGEPGRWLMGCVVICGAAAAVNSILIASSSTLDELAERYLLPGLPARGLNRRLITIILAVLVAICMAGGLAGHDILETYIQGALILWVVLIGMKCFAAARLLRGLNVHGAGWGVILGIVYLASALFLLFVDEHSGVLLRFMSVVVGTSAAVSLLWLWKRPVYEVTQVKPEHSRGNV